MKQKIEAAIRETLVVENKQSIWRAVEKILLIVEQEQALRQANVSGSLPFADLLNWYQNADIPIGLSINDVLARYGNDR